MQWRISSLVKAFASPVASFGELDAESVATLIATASDIALILDADGVVTDMAFQSEELANDLRDSTEWVGRRLGTCVAPDSRPKVAAMLRDADKASVAKPRWRHINHLGEAGKSVPVLYCAVQAGEGDRIVAFGRDLRALSSLQQKLMAAQETLERDYSRLRETEMRYRLLFQMSSEALIILDANKLRGTECNPAARTLLGFGEQTSGFSLGDIFHPESIESVQSHLNAARAGVRADDITVRLKQGDAGVSVAASLFRQENANCFLVRISQEGGGAASMTDTKRKLLKIVESAPDGFVVTDAAGNILTANAAFLGMAGLVTEEQAQGESLDRWVGRNGVELDVLMSSLRQRGSVRFFTTTVRAEDSTISQVEISAVTVGTGGASCFGFAIRNIGPRLQVEPKKTAHTLPRSVEQLTELIGRVSLKELVRESTDVIEKMCIEAALELAGDNRASAAEMLGLSRQSLYVKLRRYGLGDLSPYEEN
jgi:transcriptional regulator PpsR